MSPEFLPGGQFRAGLAALLDAFDSAIDTKADRWDFAVDVHMLRDTGATVTNLRWLVRKGYAEHAFEQTLAGDEQRGFQQRKTLNYQANSCFVLSASGADFARQHLPYPSSVDTQRLAAHPSQLSADPTEKPCWSREHRQLTFAGELIKRLVRPARVQELALAKFESEGWPDQIDARSFLGKGVDFKTSLHDVISSLNRNRLSKRIHFCSDGTSSGIRWELQGHEPAKTRQRRKKSGRGKKRRRNS